MLKKFLAVSLVSVAVAGIGGLTTAFAATSVTPASSTLTFTPSTSSQQKLIDNAISSGNFKAASPTKHQSTGVQPSSQSLPWSFSFNGVGTGAWSSSHFTVTDNSFEVGSAAYSQNGSSGTYYIQAFRDTFTGYTALGTYSYPYYGSASSQQTYYGDWVAVGPGDYNIQVKSDGPYINGGGSITQYN